SIIGLSEILELTFARGDKTKIREGFQGIIKEARRIQKVTEKLTKLQSIQTKDYVGGTNMLEL
ncbi:MAG: hypothetical protein KAI81_06725, partial [Candidatus Marinimicrobia bacterium]|nr:hypothetical protein [Candidatus Neomarinimicrobiota bacterium]